MVNLVFGREPFERSQLARANSVVYPFLLVYLQDKQAVWQSCLSSGDILSIVLNRVCPIICATIVQKNFEYFLVVLKRKSSWFSWLGLEQSSCSLFIQFRAKMRKKFFFSDSLGAFAQDKKLLDKLKFLFDF